MSHCPIRIVPPFSGRAPESKRSGTRCPHGIGHKDGKALFLTPELSGVNGNRTPARETYPFILIQGHVLQHLGSGDRSSRSKRLSRLAPRAVLGVAPDDLERLDLREGDQVRVVSAHGKLAIPVCPDPTLPPGLVFLPASFAEARPNQLFGWDWSGGKKGMNTIHCPVRLEKEPGA